MRRTIALIFFLLPALAMADQNLDQAKVMYEDMDYEKALVRISSALRSSEMEPADLVEAYKLQGLCLVASDFPDQALEAFKMLLSLDPKAKISTDISPKLAAPFYQALAISKDLKPISLSHKQTQGADWEVLLVSDPMGLVKSVRVNTSRDGIDWQKGEPQVVSGPGTQKFKADPQATQYYFEALTEGGGILSRAGSASEPFEITKNVDVVAAAKNARSDPKGGAVDTSSGGANDYEDNDDGAAVTWYKTWWFWTAVGVVVVGGAVGAGVGATSGGEKSSNANYSITVN